MAEFGSEDSKSSQDTTHTSSSFASDSSVQEPAAGLTLRHKVDQANGAAFQIDDTRLDINSFSYPNESLSKEPLKVLDSGLFLEGQPQSHTPFDSIRRDDRYEVPLKTVPTFSNLSHQYGPAYACFTIVLQIFKNNWGLLAFLLFQIFAFTLLGTLVFDPLPWQAWYSFVVLGTILALMVSNKATPLIAMLLGVTAILVAKVVEPTKVLKGLSSQSVATVAVLFIVAEGVQRTSVLVPVFRILLGKPKTLVEAQLRTMVPVAVFSAFLNNTPLVAMLIPVIQSWSMRAGFSASKMLMLMNNATILGGTLTLLGTSANLVVDALVRQNGVLKVDGSAVGVPIFGITPVGAIVAIAGIIYMAIFSRWLLRDRGQTGVDSVIQNPREYTVALVVAPESPIVGKNLEDAGLRQLRGLFLVEITRCDGTIISAAGPDTRIEAGDTLLVAGVVEAVTELYHIRGLAPATPQSAKMKLARHKRRLVELVIAASSGLVLKTAKESRFRSRFNAAIIGAHRQGDYAKIKIGDIKLRAGDSLLVETGKDFVKRFGKDANFALIAEVLGSQPPREDLFHMLLAATVTIAMIAVAAAKVLPLVTTAAVAAFVMVASGCVSTSHAGRSVKMSVLITIGASFGIAEALSETGAAEQIGKAVLQLFEPLGETGLLLGIYFGTALMTSVVPNSAAVALMFPVIQGIFKVQEARREVSINSKLKVLYVLMMGGSSSFSTPIATQTNLMVHGPGGYNFLDWVFFGIPMQILLGALVIVVIRVLNFSL